MSAVALDMLLATDWEALQAYLDAGRNRRRRQILRASNLKQITQD